MSYGLRVDEKGQVPLEMMAELTPQCRKVFLHMFRSGHITGDYARTYHRVISLSRRICDMRPVLERYGFRITTENCRNPHDQSRYRRYHLKVPETADVV